MKRMRVRSMVVAAGVVVAIGGAVIATAGGNPEAPYAKVVKGDVGDIARNVSAISGPRDSADTLTPAAEATLARLPDEMKAQLPSDVAQKTRRVFDADGVGPVFIAPSESGFALITGEGVGFVAGILSDAMPVAGTLVQRTAEDPVSAYGVATDNVNRIDVIAAGRTSRATLRGNGYYWVADTAVSLDDVSLLVHLRNGRVVRP